MLIATLATLAISLAQSGDTASMTVGRGDRFELTARSGEITIRTWNRNTVQVRSERSGGAALARRGSTVTIRTSGRYDAEDDFDVTVPAWMDLSLNDQSGDVHVTGSNASIAIQSVDGDIDVRGGNGVITLTSVQGGVSLRDAQGKISLSSVNSDVSGSGLHGDVMAQTINGEITLDRIESDNVDANTVNGDVTFDGPIRSGGRYRFVTHNGDIAVSVQENADATVSVSTFQGEFEAGFPVSISPRLSEHDKKRFTFTLGSGSARIELESFQGTMRLQRPLGQSGQTRSRR
ncbi:MAG: DUF4097 family beta strand repeat-containing protein [Gemmatimonadota bacterium]